MCAPPQDGMPGPNVAMATPGTAASAMHAHRIESTRILHVVGQSAGTAIRNPVAGEHLQSGKAAQTTQAKTPASCLLFSSHAHRFVHFSVDNTLTDWESVPDTAGGVVGECSCCVCTGYFLSALTYLVAPFRANPSRVSWSDVLCVAHTQPAVNMNHNMWLMSKKGDVKTLEYLISQGKSVNAKNSVRAAPLKLLVSLYMTTGRWWHPDV